MPDKTLNIEPFEFTGVDGETYSVPSFGMFKAGAIRKVRHLDEVSQMFTLLEQVASPEALAAVDDMSIVGCAEFYSDWQSAAAVTLPN